MRIGIFGNNRDRIPDVAFRVMSCLLALRDRFSSPWSVLDEFGIDRGRTVVDYGCGPGSYCLPARGRLSRKRNAS